MRGFFYPKSVAVIGVSARPTNLGRNIVANLVEYEFDGIVYAVGPSGGTVETRRIYPTVNDIPDEVDLAVIFTPAKTTPEVMEACGRKGIPRVVIESAGFREYGEEGKRLEDEIVRIAKKYGMRFIGPNCIGVMNMENGLCIPFPRLEKLFDAGDISMISQSGGVGMSVLSLMANEGLRLNKFASVGNVLDTRADELLEYLIEDPGTSEIFVYLESIQDGRRLMDIARKSHKPILVIKANIGKLGQNIAKSHTASLTSDDKVVEAAFRQVGILRVHDATTLGNNLKILRLPPMRGKRLAIISRSGGHAVIAADACELSGFELAQFSGEFLEEIEGHFRASVIKLTNPLDLGDLFDLNIYAQIVERTLQQENVDGIVFLHTALSDEENLTSRALLERIIEMVERYKKPVAYYLSTSAQEFAYLKQNFAYPVFTQVVETIRALEISYNYFSMAKRLERKKEIPHFEVDRAAVGKLLEAAKLEGRDLLLSEALSLLEIYGIQSIQGRRAQTIAEAQQAAQAIGYPVAIKIISEQISHKSDVGGVQLNLRNPEALAEAFTEMMERITAAYPLAKIDGVLVQPMAVGGKELILGGKQDPQFGPVVMVGLGGIFVEILNEVSVRVAPIDAVDADEMINELSGVQILKGARGDPAADLAALTEALLRLAQLLQDFPEIKEVDINPLRVFYAGEGCRALDARMVLERCPAYEIVGNFSKGA